MASMACVKWCQTSPSWPAGKWELLCCWSQEDCGTLCFHGQHTLLSSAAQKSYCELGRKGLKTRSHEGQVSPALFLHLLGASTDRPELPCPAPMKAHLVSTAHPESHSLTSSLRSCPALPSARQNTMLGCTKCSAGLSPEQSRLLPHQPRAWPADLCCLHPPAQTGLRLAIIYLGLCFNPIWLSQSFQGFSSFPVGRGRRGTAPRSPEEWGMCEQKLFALLPLKMAQVRTVAQVRTLLYAMESFQAESFTRNGLQQHSAILQTWKNSSSSVLLL